MDPQEGEQMHQILGYVYDKKGASVNTNEIAQTLSITRNVAYKLTNKLIQQGDVVNCSSKDNIDTLDVFSTSKTKIAYLSDKYRDKKRNLLTRYNDGVKIPVLFLSYSWDNQTEAEIIYNDLTQIGIKIIKDNHDLNYKDNLDDFMQSIRNADFAIVLLSDAYLKSKNCMNEIQHLLKEQDIKKKILPIIIDGTKLFSAMDRLSYVQHWEEQEEILKNRVAKVNPLNALDILADLKSVGHISASIDNFIKEVTRMLTFKFSEMKGEKYLSLLTTVGFENVTWATDLLEIIGIESAQIRGISLDAYSEKYPLNTYYYTLKATTNQKNGRFDEAKFNFQQAIKLDSKNVEALNNLGFLFETKYQEFELAKEYYEAALYIDDKLVVARINLANILAKHFDQVTEAKTHYELVINQDPSEKKAYNNLANLYSRDYPDPAALVKAYELYEKALQLDKNYVEAYINFGQLLLKEGRLIEAKDILESAGNADKQLIYTDHINKLIAKTTL